MQKSSVPPVSAITADVLLFFVRVMKHAREMLRPSPSSTRRLQVEELPPGSPASASWLPRLTLGGAICGSFAGSFAGALLGLAVGVVSRDISLGLDGAILGAVVAAVAGAAYGLLLALREKRNALSADDETSVP